MSLQLFLQHFVSATPRSKPETTAIRTCLSKRFGTPSWGISLIKRGGFFLISFHNSLFFMKREKNPQTCNTSIPHSESSFWNIWSYPSEIMSSLDTGCDNQVAYEVLLYYNYSVMPGFSTYFPRSYCHSISNVHSEI